MANYRDDFFGPIRVPALRSINRKEVRIFLEKYRKYVVCVTERARLADTDPQIMQMKLCVNDKLLRTLVRFEIKVPLEDLTDEILHEYLAGVMAPDQYHVPDLDRLFGRLRLREEGDGRDRVTALFADIDELVTDNGLRHLPERDIVQYMYKALPKHVEKSVKTRLKLEGDDDSGNSLAGIYGALVTHLDGMKFFEGTSGQPLGTGRRGAMKRPGLQCYACGGPHMQRHCPNNGGDRVPTRVGGPSTVRESGWRKQQATPARTGTEPRQRPGESRGGRRRLGRNERGTGCVRTLQRPGKARARRKAPKTTARLRKGAAAGRQ